MEKRLKVRAVPSSERSFDRFGLTKSSWKTMDLGVGETPRFLVVVRGHDAIRRRNEIMAYLQGAPSLAKSPIIFLADDSNFEVYEVTSDG